MEILDPFIKDTWVVESTLSVSATIYLFAKVLKRALKNDINCSVQYLLFGVCLFTQNDLDIWRV